MVNFRDHHASMMRQGFYDSQGIQDADGAIFMARELELIEARTYEVLYQEIKFRQLIPVDNSVPPGVKRITYKVFDKRGKPAWLNTGAKDLPRMDISGKDVGTPVHWLGGSFGYDLGEIESARFAGMPLEQAKANAVRRGFEEELNDVFYYGQADLGFTGLFTVGNGIPRTTAPDGASTNPEWDTKTADEIVADVNLLFSKPVEDTLEVEKPDYMLLPTAQYNLIATTRVPDTDTNILNYLITKVPWIAGPDRIVSVPELAGAGTAGVDVAVAYTRNPDKMEFKIPQELTFHPVQLHQLEWTVPATAVCGGLVIRYPLSAHILESI
jgi:hypothetical protein